MKFFWGYALDKRTKGLVYNFSAAPPDSLLLPPENGEVLDLFREVASYGGVLAAHCEDRHILARSAELLGHPIETYDDLLAARPAAAESTSIAVGAQFARVTGCRFHVVHMASAEGARVVREARAAGVPITAETCPHYLTLTDRDAARLGPSLKVYPPVRTAADQEALWAAIDDDVISSVGSDHAPHLVEEKMLGFGQAPAGDWASRRSFPSWWTRWRAAGSRRSGWPRCCPRRRPCCTGCGRARAPSGPVPTPT